MARVPSDVESEMIRFTNGIKQRIHTRSLDVALATVLILKKLIGESSWSNTSELIRLVRSQAHRLNESQPIDSIVFNIIRRILKVIREESIRILHGKNEGSDVSLTLQAVLYEDYRNLPSLADEEHSSGDDGAETEATPRGTRLPLPRTSEETTNLTSACMQDNVPAQKLKPELMDALNEYSRELEDSTRAIARESVQHIHANELILTLGYSYTVEQFFRYAASKKRKFHVFVLEEAPFFSGHKMAAELSQLDIPVTVVTDSAVFAIMARVNKIVVGTRSVLANGGITARCGTYNLALAAKHYSVPLVVCAPTYKFSPTYLPSFDPVMCNSFESPDLVVPFDSTLQSSLDVIVPLHDYVPPELVTLIIGNGPGNAPSYVYRLVSELYSAEDNDLERPQKALESV